MTSFDASSFETKYESGSRSEQSISFFQPGTKLVTTGMRAIDMDKKANLRLNTYAEHVNDRQYKAIIKTWGDSKLYSASMPWLCVTNDNPYELQAGRFDGSPTTRTANISFLDAYEKSPCVVVWLSRLDLGCGKNRRLKTEAKNVTRQGFTISHDTWFDTVWYSASENWIAHQADHPRIRSGSYNTEQVRPCNSPTPQTHGTLSFFKPFEKPPFVVTAVSSVDFDQGQNIRFKMPVTNITNRGFPWGLDTWGIPPCTLPLHGILLLIRYEYSLLDWLILSRATLI